MDCQTIESYDEENNPVYRPKKTFDTLDIAIINAKKVNCRDNVTHKVVGYKCRICKKYHLGRNGSRVTDKERKKWKIELSLLRPQR